MQALATAAPLDAARLAVLERARLPLDGAIARHVPAILAAAARVIGEWQTLDYVDLTAGSCLLPMAFAAGGARRVVVNDPAPRTMVAARALFGGRQVDRATLAAILAGTGPRSRPHRPTHSFLSDFFLEPASALFDRLFHVALPPAEAAPLRYLALRWMLGFVASEEDGFALLATHDRAQLAADRDVDWRPALARIDDAPRVLARLADEIDAGVAAVRSPQVELRCGDMVDVARRLALRAPALVAANPPTAGLDEYVVDDQIVHSLIANRLVPLARSAETPAAFWTARVSGALAALPPGVLFLVWAGDGELDADASRAVWNRYGRPLVEQPAGDDAPGAVWAIYRRS